MPTVVPHLPSRDSRSSSGICRTRARIRPQVSSVGPSPAPLVPLTAMPSSDAASMSKEALRRPVVTSRRRLGSRASRERGKAVRSRIPITTSKPPSRSAKASSSAKWPLKNTTSVPGRQLRSSRPCFRRRFGSRQERQLSFPFTLVPTHRETFEMPSYLKEGITCPVMMLRLRGDRFLRDEAARVQLGYTFRPAPALPSVPAKRSTKLSPVPKATFVCSICS